MLSDSLGNFENEEFGTVTVTFSITFLFRPNKGVPSHSPKGEDTTHTEHRHEQLTIDLLTTDNSWDFAITEFNNCFIIRLPGLFL